MAPVVTRLGVRRRPAWLTLAFVLLLVVPLLEIVVIIGVGRVIGGWPTFGLLLVESALGAWLVRREGARSWRALQQALTTGQMPSRQLADAALVLVGGVLLLAPGFLTDIVGFALVLPFTRPLFRGLLEAAVGRRLLSGVYASRVPGSGATGPQDVRPGGRGSAASDDIIEGEVL